MSVVRAQPEGADGTRVIRVVLGEDSHVAREGLTRVLDRIADVELVETAEDLDSMRAAVDRVRPDVVLTDIRMPPTHTDEGIQLAVELRSSRPEIAVVVLSQHAEVLYAMSLLTDGSDGRAYLLKERVMDESQLSRALHEVANGGSLVDPLIVDELLAERSRQELAQLDQLTPREREILGLMAEGKGNTAIADLLVITKRAVERHINAIFRKLERRESEDVSRRVKAALMYLSGHTA